MPESDKQFEQEPGVAPKRERAEESFAAKKEQEEIGRKEIVSPAEETRRREIIRKKMQELERKEVEETGEEKKRAREILEEAKKAEGANISLEEAAERLVEAVFQEGLENVLRALREEGDPYLFDKVRDRLTEPEVWQRLIDQGEL